MAVSGWDEYFLVVSGCGVWGVLNAIEHRYMSINSYSRQCLSSQENWDWTPIGFHGHNDVDFQSQFHD